jgi:Leucine-rich repeat (LRR) protein
VLDLSGNPSISGELAATTSLRALRASDCGLHSLSLLSSAPNIELLALDGNNLEEVEELVRFPALRRVDLSRNPIRSLEPLQSATHLEEIIIDSAENVGHLAPLRNRGVRIMSHAGAG